jgi:hypothetical protein
MHQDRTDNGLLNRYRKTVTTSLRIFASAGGACRHRVVDDSFFQSRRSLFFAAVCGLWFVVLLVLARGAAAAAVSAGMSTTTRTAGVKIEEPKESSSFVAEVTPSVQDIEGPNANRLRNRF